MELRSENQRLMFLNRAQSLKHKKMLEDLEGVLNPPSLWGKIKGFFFVRKKVKEILLKYNK